MSRNTKDHLEQFHVFDVHVPSRTISLFSVHTDMDGDESGVESSMAEKAIKNLAILEALNKDPITIILNTPGGDWYNGMAIYDAVKACKSHVTIKGIGQVMSMGSVIMQAADKRVLYPNTKVMIHYGTFGFEGHSKTAQKWAKEADKLDSNMEEILFEKIKAKNPAFKFARLKNMLDHDTILSAKEALELGLADEILGEDEDSDE
jgi:ATP-dependent Clp protease protease subunit